MVHSDIRQRDQLILSQQLVWLIKYNIRSLYVKTFIHTHPEGLIFSGAEGLLHDRVLPAGVKKWKIDYL